MTRALALCSAACLLAIFALAQTAVSRQAPIGPQPPPGAQPPSPAEASAAPPADPAPHDGHDGITVSARPLTDLDLAREKFGKANPLPVGILPVEVFLHNETNAPFRIDLSTVQLSVHARGHSQDIEWLALRDVATAVAHPHGPSAPHAPRFPPVGMPSTGDPKADKMLAILQPLALDADVLPPQSVLHGYLFFDVDRDLSLAEDASLYIPDVSTIPAHKPLMFFEVPLSTTAPAKP